MNHNPDEHGERGPFPDSLEPDGLFPRPSSARADGVVPPRSPEADGLLAAPSVRGARSAPEDRLRPPASPSPWDGGAPGVETKREGAAPDAPEGGRLEESAPFPSGVPRQGGDELSCGTLDSSGGPEAAPGSTPGASRTEEEKPRSGILEALALVCVAFVLALTLKSYVAEAYEIKGKSMEPSFTTGQRVIVLKAFYEVDRGDVVVFASTEDVGKDLIKRVVGLPGDRIEGHDGKVFVNGTPLEETYVEFPSFTDFREEEVPPGRFYVLGDNRPDSHDSRYFHSVPERNLKGKVVLRWWPLEDFDFFAD